MTNNNRRSFIKNTGLGVGMALLYPVGVLAENLSLPKKITVLIVSGWQDVNIGDIAHTPGLLEILKKYLPQAKLILWKKSRSKEVKSLLLNNYPDVKIIYGDAENPGKEVLDAIEKSDLLVHGSGPFVVGRTNILAWIKYTNKPFGIFGTSIPTVDSELKSILEKAAFIYTRETNSLKVLAKEGLSGSNILFAPDATFSLNIKDEKKAVSFLKTSGLFESKFICVIPRLRKTPYHWIRDTNEDERQIREKEELNNKYKEVDHAKMREAMISWVRETGNKVLVCPEMTYQVEIMDELLINPLPEDVKPFVVKRGYWLPDEAASVYSRAAAVLSFECHSPIIASAVSTPFLYLRQPTDTNKGQMYYDLGFSDWVFEIDGTNAEQIVNELRKIWNDHPAAVQLVKEGLKQVHGIYKKAINTWESIS